jgi:alpha-galactosidase
MAKKIVLVGAGSAVFTSGLVADLIQAPDLGPWTLGLVDIDPEALDMADRLSHRMVGAKGADIDIEASVDRREVLGGADVVVTTIGVGGRRAWEIDVLIPRKYGIYQPVGDTVMPGGISRAMRMIPALVDIARDVASLCPSAWLFNYANPMTANCWAIRQVTGVPVVGLCHGTFHVLRQLAGYAGAPPKEITSLFAGLNHLTFIYDLRWRGQELWPAVRARLPREQPATGGPSSGTCGVTENPFSWSLYDAYGAYPSANDRHVVEFFPERFPQGNYYGKVLGTDVFSFEETIAHGDRAYADMRAQALGAAPLDERIFERSEGEHEQLVDILRCIWSDHRRVFAANVPNGGAVPGLPQEAILELPIVTTATGLRPIQLFDLSNALKAVLARKLAATRLTVESALSGDRKLFVEALLADGAVCDPETAARLGEELLQAQRRHLPQFFPAG